MMPSIPSCFFGGNVKRSIAHASVEVLDDALRFTIEPEGRQVLLKWLDLRSGFASEEMENSLYWIDDLQKGVTIRAR